MQLCKNQLRRTLLRPFVNTQKPNVLIISIDSLRADHMGMYGYSKNTTPFLDSLARKGVVFDNAYSPGIFTFQSDISMLAGMYPSEHGAIDWNKQLSPDVQFFTKTLKEDGYSSAIFASPSMYPDFGIDKQVDYFEMAKSVKNINQSNINVSNWMLKQQNPYVLYWHVYDVHLPYMVPPNYNSYNTSLYDCMIKSSNNSCGYVFQNQNITGVPKNVYIRGRLQVEFHNWTSGDLDYLNAAYDYGISYTDSQLRDFFSKIQKSPEYNNTLIIITSSHGDDIGEHGFFFHRDVYDVNVHVPLIIIHPSLLPKRVQEPVSLIDVAPTVMSFVNATEKIDYEGKNLLLSNNTAEYVYVERVPFDEYMVRKGQYKYILRNPNKKLSDLSEFMSGIGIADTAMINELYDLNANPKEQNNLIGRRLDIEQELYTKALLFRENMRFSLSQEHVSDTGLKIFTYP